MTSMTSSAARRRATANTAAHAPPQPAWDLFERLVPLGGPVVFEPSWKLEQGRVLDGRFLVSFPPPSAGPRTRALFGLLDELGLPALYRPACEANLADAVHLHLGVEPGPEGQLLKFYLELSQRRVPGELGDVLVHLAFKWDPARPERHALARYYDRSVADVEGLAGRVADICGDRAAGVAADAAALVEQVRDRMPVEDIMLLETLEAGNPRRTFDLCVYDARIRVSELGDWIGGVFERFDIPPAKRAALLARVGDGTLGHFAGGVARDGGIICSLFFGAGYMKPAAPPPPRGT